MFQDIRTKIGIGVAALGQGALGGRFLPETIPQNKTERGSVNYSADRLGVQLDIPRNSQSQSVSEFTVALEKPGTYEISVSPSGSISGIVNDRIDVGSEAQTRHVKLASPMYDPLFTVVKIQADGTHGPTLYASTQGAKIVD